MTQTIETTAQLREAARAAEKRLDWERAADLWNLAIARHPGSPRSAMYQADLARMSQRAAACQATARVERL